MVNEEEKNIPTILGTKLEIWLNFVWKYGQLVPTKESSTMATGMPTL